MFTLNQLIVFKRVVETGSFNKAAAEEYITTNAVMKQMNKLETELGARLLIRSHRGAELTEAGISFYEDAVKILSICESSAFRARTIADKASPSVKFGASFANRPEDLENILTKVVEKHPEIRIEMIPFENTPDATAGIYTNLGGKIDVVASTFDDYTKNYWEVEGIETSKVPFCVVLPKTHRLSKHKRITFENLSGEKLIIIRRGYSLGIDEVRDYIESNCPNISLIDVPAFGMELYNKTVNENLVMLGLGDSIAGRPFTRRIPLDWDKKYPFGILYAKNPSKHVEKFISAVKDIVESDNK